MTRIAYYRVSTRDQSGEAQRAVLGDNFAREFIDEGVSGAMQAASRPAFSELLAYIREGDELFVYAIDRLGRDAIDVQATVRSLLDKGVTVNVHGLGQIGRGVGELIVAVLAQVANMERDRIAERTASGRALAQETLRRTGKTHRGKTKFGRDFAGNPEEVRAWRYANGGMRSIKETADHFGLSESTVKRYCVDPLETTARKDRKAAETTLSAP